MELWVAGMGNYIIPNLMKTSRLLSLLARSGSGLTAAEIESSIQLPKATAFRILKTLGQSGFVRKENGKYHTGPALVEIGILSLAQAEIRKMAVPVLQELTESTGFTSHLAIPSGCQSLILEVRDSPNPVQVASRPGSLVDLHCTSTGKIFMAFNFHDRMEMLLSAGPLKKYTRYTIVDPAALKAAARKVREQDYAIDDREYHDDIRCVAAPVRDINNRVIAAIGITAPVIQFPLSKTEMIVTRVLQASGRLSSRMGAS